MANQNKTPEHELHEIMTIRRVLEEVKMNLKDVQKQWLHFQEVAASNVLAQKLSNGEVIVDKSSLEKLASECERMKSLIPKLICSDVFTAAIKFTSLEDSLERGQVVRDSLKADVMHWKTQMENTVTQAQKDKGNCLELEMDVQDLSGQLGQQSEFSASLGSTLGTLLWSLSKQEDIVGRILKGPKSSELLELTTSCVSSYLSAYKDDQWPEQGTDEASFILALCGTITNIAASALGREHLATQAQGHTLMETFLTFISEAPTGKSTEMKSLMLTALYNLSINQKGVKYLCGHPDLIPMLATHLQEETNVNNRVNTLRLIQSVISDEDSPHIILQLKETLHTQFLQQLVSGGHHNLHQLALDLLMDIRDVDTEP